MKTKNNNTRTRKSKMKIAFLKGGAIIISFILISFTVSAQGFWKQLLTESSLSNVAMIMAGDTSMNHSKAAVNTSSSFERTTGEKTFFSSIEMEEDEPLNLESWMTSDSFLGQSNYTITPEVDPTLDIEDWMINSKYFKNVSSSIETETDKELKLEDWMVNDSLWKM